MHIGRSHHTALEVIGSLVGGFLASFATFMASSYVQFGAMKGQLIAGDPNINRQFPSTLNTFQGAIDGSNPIMTSLTSYGWWLMVSLGGIVGAFIILKLLRRYA